MPLLPCVQAVGRGGGPHRPASIWGRSHGTIRARRRLETVAEGGLRPLGLDAVVPAVGEVSTARGRPHTGTRAARPWRRPAQGTRDTAEAGTRLWSGSPSALQTLSFVRRPEPLCARAHAPSRCPRALGRFHDAEAATADHVI